MEFSPGQIELRRVLELVVAGAGDRERIVEAIRAEYFADAAESRSDPDERLKQQRTRSKNVLWGMGTYGLFNLDANRLTDAGENLVATPTDRDLSQSLAQHILKECNGIEVLQAASDLRAQGKRVTKAALGEELVRRGFEMPTATTRHLILLRWLAEAGVVDRTNGYEVDEARVATLIGASLRDVDDWGTLTRAQRAFLQALKKLSVAHGAESIRASAIVEQAKLEHGPIFREDQLRSTVFKPLEDQGWIELSNTSRGRGGKSGQIVASDKLLAADLESLVGFSLSGVPAELRQLLNTPLSEIHTNLSSEDTHVKGIALELLALRIIIDLGLEPVRVRERGVATGGAEVDVIAEGRHLHFSRWLFQCKNVKGNVGLNALAKEVGMAVMLRAHVIVIATTSEFSSSVYDFARELAATTSHQVVLLGGNVLTKYRESGPDVLRAFFQEKAGETLRMKRGQLDETSGERETTA